MLFQVWEYFRFFFLKEDHHSIHSPFFFSFYESLKGYIRDNRKGEEAIERQRRKFLGMSEKIQVTDFGAGSRWNFGGTRKVASIIKRSNTSIRFSLLYQFLCQQTPAITVLDLGTSLGINTAYLATVTKGELYTFEGDPALVALAKSHLGVFSSVGIVSGNIDSTLIKTLQNIECVDFALMDANHRYQPTMDYFRIISPRLHPNSILVIADIHWSKEMRKAWNELKALPSVTGSMDFFECGVLFFGKHGNNNDFVLEI
jgi:predicted O-methyltransferase YrrM